MKTRRLSPRKLLVLGLLLTPVLAGDVLLLARGRVASREAIFFLVSACLVFGAIMALRRVGGETIPSDERTMRIDERSMGYSWQITIYALTLCMLNENLGLAPLSSLQYLFVVMAVMIVSNLAGRAALSGAGDAGI